MKLKLWQEVETLVSDVWSMTFDLLPGVYLAAELALVKNNLQMTDTTAQCYISMTWNVPYLSKSACSDSFR